MNAYGAFQTFYQLDFLKSQSSSAISWIGSTQGFLLFLISMAAGPVFDAGHLRLLLWVGSFFLVAGTLLVSLTSHYWQVFVTQAIMIGLGLGCLYLPAPAVVSQYFNKNTALAMSISSAGSAIGGVLYPIAFTHLEQNLGFGWAIRILGFLLLATSIPPVVLMRTKLPPKSSWSIIDQKALQDIPYLLLNLGLFFGFMGLYIVFYYIELFAIARTDISHDLAGYLLIILNLSSLPGRVIPGYYADKIGSINVQTAMVFLNAILAFCLVTIRTTSALLVVCVLFGFSAGAFMGLPAAGIVSLTADKTRIGTRIGMTLAFVGFGVLVSNPIAGAILGDGGKWTGLICWCGALCLASTLSMLASRVTKVGYGFKTVI
jgi:MFS family permease